MRLKRRKAESRKQKGEGRKQKSEGRNRKEKIKKAGRRGRRKRQSWLKKQERLNK
jgi:hypothetical protein